MKKWQREYIKKCLPDLLESTEVTAPVQVILKSSGILSDGDCSKLKAIATTEGKHGATKELYDIAVTRLNAYRELGKTLYETSQSGAFIVLLKGLLLHLLKNDQVHLDDGILDDILQKMGCTKDSLQLFLSQISLSRLFTYMLPEIRDGFYISRLISNRVKLDEMIFGQSCEDVFVFKGLVRSELTKLAGSNMTKLSRSVLLEKKISCRFILLEEKCENDWEEICKYSSTPTHLIRYDQDSKDFILERSCGAGDFISKYRIQQSKDKSLYIAEKDFFIGVDTQDTIRNVCICDKPGMGKTWLLENIARGMKQRHPDRMVVLIGLSEFIRNVATTAKFDQTTALKILLGYRCCSNLTLAILEKILMQETSQFEIFLDGFDEIPTENIELAYKFISAITKAHSHIRLFITSRPHVRKDLEKAIGVMAYDIMPFCQQNQLDFLVNFWKLKFGNKPCLEEKLEEFARACLKNLNDALTQDECELMGIPLQCLLLATVNEDNAWIYVSRRDATTDPGTFITATSMNDMYKLYVEKGIRKALQNYEDNTDIKGSGRISNIWSKVNFNAQGNKPETFHSLKSFHVWKALELLCPEIAEEYFHKADLLVRHPSLQHYACGLLQKPAESTSGIVETTFVHRTMAEYLVADYFAELLTSPRITENFVEKVSRVILENTLATKTIALGALSLDIEFIHQPSSRPDRWLMLRHYFHNSTIGRFLNASLDSISISRICLPLAKSFRNLLKDHRAAELLSACIESGFLAIIRLLRHIITIIKSSNNNNPIQRNEMRRLFTFEFETNEGKPLSEDEKYFRSTSGYLYMTAVRGDVKVIQEIYALFRECLNEDLDEICSQMPNDMMTPLHAAVRHRHYDVVEFFAKKICLPSRGLLHHLFPFTCYFAPDQLENVVEISKLLLRNSPELVNERVRNNFELGTPMFAPKIHVELIKFCINHGADLTLTLNQKNLVHHCALVRQKQFNELCRFLMDEVKAVELFKPHATKWEDPMPWILSPLDRKTAIRVLKLTDFDVNRVDSDGDNFLNLVICESGTLDAIQVLVERGVDPTKINDDGVCALHWAAVKGRLDVVQYLVSLGISLEICDNRKRTALLMAINYPKIVSYLLTENANIFAVNCHGNSIAHTAVYSDCMEELLACILEHKNAKDIFKLKNENGQTPLHHWLVSRKRLIRDTVEPIFKLSNVDSTSTDGNGENIFLGAVRGRRTVTGLELLKKFGADHSVTNKDGENAIHLAVKRDLLSERSVDVVVYLLSVGCNGNQLDVWGNTPLDSIISTEKWCHNDPTADKDLIPICQKLITILSSFQ